MLKNKPLVSVVTIVRNGATHIEQAMLSVFNQDYPNIEYIIIDGASTDGTQQLIAKHADKLSYFISEPDTGISNAVNKSLPHVKGEYVAFLSSDNYFESSAISSLVDSLSPSTHIVHADFIFHDHRIPEPCIYTTNAKSLPVRMSVCPEAMLIKTKTLNSIGGYNENKLVAADHYLLLSIYKTFGLASFVHTPVPILNFRSGGLADRRAFLGYRECMENKIELGYGKFFPRITFIYQCARTAAGTWLKRFGLFKLFSKQRFASNE